jgi:hypothetical protein
VSHNHPPAGTTRAELEEWIDKSELRLICTAVLNKEIKILNQILRRLRLKALDDRSLWANILATLILAALLYFLTITITALFDSTRQLWNPAALFVSLLSAIALSVVKYLHDDILTRDNTNFAKEIIPEEKHKPDLQPLLRWWKSFLNPRCEIPFVLVFAVLAVVSLRYFALFSVGVHLGGYVLLFLCGIALGQGGYCAVRIPRLAKILRGLPLEMFWLYPADTQWIKQASSIFTRLALANAFFGASLMLGLLWLRPWKSSMTIGIAIVWLLLTWVVVLYSFLYPHYQLGKILEAEKARQSVALQSSITALRTMIGADSDESGLKKLNETIKVYDQLESARASAIDAHALVSLFLSLGVPVLSFFAVLIDLGRRLAEFWRGSATPH